MSGFGSWYISVESGPETLDGTDDEHGVILADPVRYFAIATLMPVPLLVLGAVFGGGWLWIALAYMTLLVFSLDELVSYAADPMDPAAEFPTAARLSVALAVLHFALLALAVWAISGASGLGWGERLVAFFAFGLFFGQVSNSNAHELIHRSDRVQFELGKWIYISLLFGHHTSAHRLVHHRFVASADDPNSAKLGESYYAFARRAWWGSFQAGLTAERTLERSTTEQRLQPYFVYVAGALTFMAAIAKLGGLTAVIAYICLAAYATAQLLMSDYVQHYGLRRTVVAGGKLEPVGPQHSWNTPHWFSSYLMLNTPRHSDHHAHPARKFPGLELAEDMPMLPRSLPVMGFVALFPSWWRRIMDRRVAKIQANVTSQ